MSHGSEGFVDGKDGQIPVERLWKNFTADLCPSLANKPKMFFIQVRILVWELFK